MVRNMNDLYVLEKSEPYQLVKDVEQIEGGYYLAEFDDSLSLDLNEPGKKKPVEQRCHKRFHLRDRAFALIRSKSDGPLNIQGKSMGCIACAVFNARPASLGKIDNISMGGLMFSHVAGKTESDRTFVLEILLADCRFHLANVQFEIKSDMAVPEDIPGSPFKMRQVRLQFRNLSAYQKSRLNDFLLNHGKKIGDNGVKDQI